MLPGIIHQQALSGNALGFSSTMNIVIKITNAIRGGNRALIHWKFKDFLNEIDAEYGDILLHIHVRLLSEGKCLKRFVQLRNEIKPFLLETALDSSLIASFNEKAFLTDITDY